MFLVIFIAPLKARIADRFEIMRIALSKDCWAQRLRPLDLPTTVRFLHSYAEKVVSMH